MDYVVVYEQGERNWGAWVPDVPGCVATGKNREQAGQRIREALALHLEAMARDGEPWPQPGQFAEVVSLPIGAIR